MAVKRKPVRGIVESLTIANCALRGAFCRVCQDDRDFVRSRESGRLGRWIVEACSTLSSLPRNVTNHVVPPRGKRALDVASHTPRNKTFKTTDFITLSSILQQNDLITGQKPVSQYNIILDFSITASLLRSSSGSENNNFGYK